MPTFFEGFKRMIQGKPVFDEGDDPSPFAERPNPSHPAPTPPPQPQPFQPKQDSSAVIQKGRERTFPVVYIKRTTSRLNGPNMQVYCRILNTFSSEIFVDKIRLLGTTKELDSTLRKGEEKEFLVYSGRRPAHDRDRRAVLQYKTQDRGDYFEATHDVKFMFQPDKTYSIDDIRLHPPVRDIFG